MPTYRENPRLYQPARSYNEIRQSLAVGNWSDTWDAGFLAAQSLVLLAVDLNQMTREWTNIQSMDLDDHHDLIKLLKYLVLVPFTVLKVYHAHQLNQAAIPPGQREQAFEAMLHGILANAIDTEAYISNITVLQLVAGPNYWNDVDNWNQNPGVRPNITALGTVELLCRIIADGCVTLDDFQTRVCGDVNHPGLDLRLLPVPPANLPMHMKTRKGIPATVFACAGQQNNDPTFVVTTSQDIWYPFTVMSQWAEDVRHTWRPGQPPVSNHGLPNLPTLSDDLMDKFFDTEVQTRNFNPQGRANARQIVLNNWNQVTNHPLEGAAPFSCPAFDFKARCFRCRGMFRYDVAPGVIVREQADSGYKWPRLTGHTGFTCAETIAQAYCTDACNGNPTH